MENSKLNENSNSKKKKIKQNGKDLYKSTFNTNKVIHILVDDAEWTLIYLETIFGINSIPGFIF